MYLFGGKLQIDVFISNFEVFFTAPSIILNPKKVLSF